MPEQQRLLDLIADGRQGILAAVTRVGYPHMTNVLYAWDAAERVARVSADRVKGRILQRDHHAALHVPGAHFWAYAVAECDAETGHPPAGRAALRRRAGAPAGHLAHRRPIPIDLVYGFTEAG
jgi:hypothetical protein